jgi:uncharacterized membrane protein YoaK (UPF0700 family)
MRRSAVLSRLFIALTTASLIASLVGSAAPVLGASPTRVDQMQSEFTKKVHTRHGTRGHVNPRDVAKHPTKNRPTPMKLNVPTIEPPAGADAANPSVAASAPAERTTNGSNPPAAQSGVSGINQNGPFSNGEPPDPWIAAGPEHVIQTTNVAMRILDRSGNTLVPDFSLADFFGLPAGFSNSDPRVHFDSLHQRWFVTELSWTCDIGDGTPVGFIDFLVSDTADPLGNWTLWYFGFENYLPDYPGLGSSTNKLAFAANFFELGPGCSFPGDDFVAYIIFDWADVLADGALGVPDEIDWIGLGLDPSEFSTPRVAMQTPATSAALHTVIQANGGVAWDPFYVSFTGTVLGDTLDVGNAIDLADSGAAAPWVEPPDPQQPGSPATVTDKIDSRPTDAIWQNNRLVFVSNYGCTPTGDSTLRDCVRVTEATTNSAGTATPTAAQDFLIAENGKYNYFGGVGLAANGTLYTVWTRSSPTAGDYPSSMAAYQLTTDPANSLSPAETVALGLGNYDGISPGGRWGDYVGVSQDPQVPNAVWQANEYSGGGNDWLTHVSQLATDAGSSYVPITPERVVDSRSNVGVTGAFTASTPKSFAVAGVGPIPADAIAVTGNVTVTGQTAAGFVSITPTATSTPPSSTLNFPLGDTRANNFTSSLDSAGKLAAVYKAAAGKKAHVIVDITGYFLAGDEDGTYATIEPVRVMDTRPAPEHVGTATVFQHGVTQTLSIADANGIPANATAITGNLTVVGQTHAGFLSVTPDDPVGTPTSSTLNFPLGDVRANGLTADLNDDGDLSITYIGAAGATTHAALDITGYYVEGAGGLLFYPLNPGRVLDSRSGAVLSGISGSFTSGTPKTLEVGSHWGVPAGAEAITGNLTVVGQTAAGFVSITPTPDSSPSTSTLNFPLGDIRANGVTVPLSSDDLSLVYKAAATKKTHLLLDLAGYFK